MIEVKQIEDMELLRSFFDDRHVIKYQGITEFLCPPCEGFYYIGAFNDDDLVAIILCYNLTKVLLEVHVCTKRSALGIGEEIFRRCSNYIFSNGICDVILGKIPAPYLPCMKAAEKVGYQVRGVIPNASIVNGNKCDLVVYSICAEELI